MLMVEGTELSSQPVNRYLYLVDVKTELAVPKKTPNI